MINEYENTLRTVIILILGDTDDSEFGVTPERIEVWKQKREIEKKNNSNIQIENRLIYYSDFFDLKVIIHKNWERFRPILNDKKRFEVFNSEVENMRNTVAHGREILTFQKKMLEGIVGDLKNQLILNHAKNMDPNDFFLKILRISDNLGNIWESSNYFDTVLTNKIIRVGEELEFIVDAFDPKGREFEYRVQYINDWFITQNSNRIIVKIVPEMISKSCSIRICVTTRELGYKNEQSVYFNYTVLP
jgi:hypothetical protein